MLLILGEKSSALRVLLGQINGAVQFMMEIVSRYISLFVFVSLLSLMLSDALSNLGGVVKGVLLESPPAWCGLDLCAVGLHVPEGVLYGAAQAAAHRLITLSTAPSSGHLVHQFGNPVSGGSVFPGGSSTSPYLWGR